MDGEGLKEVDPARPLDQEYREPAGVDEGMDARLHPFCFQVSRGDVYRTPPRSP